MREVKAEAIFPGLRQYRSECVGRKILELVDKKKKVAAFSLWLIDAGHRAELKLGRQKGTQQVRFVAAKMAFGQVRDEQSFIVHYESDVDFGSDLPEDVSNH